MKVIILSGACKSGKSFLLKKVKKDLRGTKTILYDMDTLRYWEKGATLGGDFDWDEVQRYLPGGENAREKLEANLMASVPWERLVKQKMVILLAYGVDCLIINVLDRTKKDDHFYDILSTIFNVKPHFMALTPSYGRYCLNLYKRKDKKTYTQTWGMKKALEERKEIFDEILTNELFLGVRRARKRLVSMLSSV